MFFRPDPLLLELFDSLHKDLATALERRQRLSDVDPGGSAVRLPEQTDTIARLRVAVAALEGAIERRDSRIIH
jgi:hypothetical protein